MKNKILFPLIAGLIISIGALYYALRSVPITDLTQYLTTINYIWIIPAILIGIISLLIRVLRWQIILKSTKLLDFFKVFHPLMIGFMLNLILPGRVGEIARPAILSQKEGVPFTVGLASVAIERLFDLILLIMLLSVVLANVNIDPDLEIKFQNFVLNKDTIEMIGLGMQKLCILLIFGIGIITFNKTRNLIITIIMKIPSLFFFAGHSRREMITSSICKPLVEIVKKFASGFELIKEPRTIFLCFVLSFIVWLLQAFSFYLVAQGCPGISITFAQHCAVMVIICIFIALPSVPGYWGLWEAGGIFGLTLFSISAKDAAGYTLLNHGIQFFPFLAIGLVSAIMTSVNILKVSYEKYEE